MLVINLGNSTIVSHMFDIFPRFICTIMLHIITTFEFPIFAPTANIETIVVRAVPTPAAR